MRITNIRFYFADAGGISSGEIHAQVDGIPVQVPLSKDAIREIDVTVKNCVTRKLMDALEKDYDTKNQR